MWFWIRNISFCVILIALALYFFNNPDILESTGEEAGSDRVQISDNINSNAIKNTQTKTVKKKKANSAAEGLSKFYANINGTAEVNKPTIRNNIVYLPEPKGDLELLLDAKQKVVRPYPKRWQGSKDSRPFRLGETIYQKLSEYAKQDRLTVFWRINRDYVVKDAFRIEKTILNTALQLGQGISGHFQNGVSIYFCYQERAIVVIEGTKSYLDERCLLLKSKSGF